SRAGRFRSKTIAPKRLTRDEKRLAQELVYPEDVERPRTRADCQNMPRPCPFVSCEHHLYLDVNPDSGAIKLNFPQLEVWEMAETCSLDVADRGGITLEDVGAILNLTRERIRQVEVRGLVKIRTKNSEALGLSNP
ncbi:MAG: sigma factor-like helix-turn-helix DNA-binding protein, partial [Polyangia bacterium]